MIKQFCKGCGQKLATVPILGTVKGHEFEDGFYCEQCATAKVKKARGQQ